MSEAAALRPVFKPFDLESILSGKATIPNFKEVPSEKWGVMLCNLTLGGQDVRLGRVRAPGAMYTSEARYFLSTTQGGAHDGRGYVVFSELEMGRMAAHIGTFAICEHAKVEGPGADHRRGWHPGHCSKCGMDMTVDSGD